MSKETIEKTFNVDTQPKLTLTNIRGSVEIHPGDDCIIRLTAIIHQDNCDSEHTKIDFNQVDTNHVMVRTVFRNDWFGFPKINPCQIDFTVQVPRMCSLKISGVSSSTAIQGMESDMQLKSVSGQITLQDLSGLIKINSVSGNVFGRRIAGSLDFNTVSGKVRFEESQLTSVAGQTVSGNVTLQTPIVDSPFQFDSVSGYVELLVPVDTSCTAVLKSLSGRLRADFATTSDHVSGGYRRIELQGGGPEVRLKSVSGSLFLKPTKHIVTEEESEPILSQSVERSPLPDISKAPSPENNMELLERINNGELSVDEAVEIIC